VTKEYAVVTKPFPLARSQGAPLGEGIAETPGLLEGGMSASAAPWDDYAVSSRAFFGDLFSAIKEATARPPTAPAQRFQVRPGREPPLRRLGA
jgi:hypothetical protein